jgi:predicted alpha/beta hydrolase family esterase
MHAILVHGWRGWPKNAWFPWLQKKLVAKGWTVDAPALPERMFPKRDAWIAALERTIEAAVTRGIPPSKIALVGHSLGCLAILFTLERHEGAPFAKVVLVAGFARDFGAPGFGPWMERPVTFGLVRPNARAWHVLHGASDIFVPVSEGRWLAKQLRVSLTETKWPGHFMHEEGKKELPEAFEALVGGKR